MLSVGGHSFISATVMKICLLVYQPHALNLEKGYSEATLLHSFPSIFSILSLGIFL